MRLPLHAGSVTGTQFRRQQRLPLSRGTTAVLSPRAENHLSSLLSIKTIGLLVGMYILSHYVFILHWLCPSWSVDGSDAVTSSVTCSAREMWSEVCKVYTVYKVSTCGDTCVSTYTRFREQFVVVCLCCCRSAIFQSLFKSCLS